MYNFSQYSLIFLAACFLSLSAEFKTWINVCIMPKTLGEQLRGFYLSASMLFSGASLSVRESQGKNVLDIARLWQRIFPVTFFIFDQNGCLYSPLSASSAAARLAAGNTQAVEFWQVLLSASYHSTPTVNDKSVKGGQRSHQARRQTRSS